MQQVDVDRSQEFRKCIECFLCQNVCHVIRDHEDNKAAFSGPRLFIRSAELDMHPLDARTDRKNFSQQEQGIAYCNITKCCTEVCPEHIKITDNAIIPMKERVVDNKYDPLVWLGRKIFRRDELAAQQVGRLVPARPGTAPATTPAPRAPSPARVGPDVLPPDVVWHSGQQQGLPPEVDDSGRLPINEVLLDRAGAASPFGDNVEFPLPVTELDYQHPRPENE
jgi:succinate dehydrogenase / fumarate reductase iron-sulfur subunit